jgi:arylsulfatase A-like enzyme
MKKATQKEARLKANVEKKSEIRNPKQIPIFLNFQMGETPSIKSRIMATIFAVGAYPRHLQSSPFPNFPAPDYSAKSLLVRIFLGMLVYLAPCCSGCSAGQTGRRPNIIFILTDDQGYGDMSCHGNPVLKTPNIDRLHNEGVRFSDFHVSPTCAPTRSALMTGRHEFRNGVTHTILERERLTLKATTIAQLLKGAGYTTGIFGKWHLGDEAEYQPNRRGFDEVFIHGAGGIGQTYEGSCGDAPGNTYFNPAILHNGKFEKTQGYCTDVFFAQATKWMESVKGKQPFFAYIALNAPHAPLQVRPEDEARYADKVPASAAKFFGMIANIDDNLGQLLAKLAAWGLEQNTLVIFMNDNGGTAGVNVFNAGMRGSKASPWLGGTRAASFWRWPGTLKPAEVDKLAGHIDFFPTLAEIAGVKLSGALVQQVEGRSLVPLLQEPTAPWPDRVLVTHVGRWEWGQVAGAKFRNCSIRNTRWQMVCVSPAGQRNWQLFDVKADPGEKTNVAAEHAEVVKELEAAYDRWWDSVQPQLVNENAVGPGVNPFKALYWKQFGGGPER